LTNRSFQSLSPQEALHVAIFIEERNAQLYHSFAEMFVSFQDLASLDIAGVLWDMAIEERHHSSLLQQRYTLKYGQGSCDITDADISEMIELPQLNGSEVFSPNLEASDAKRHALEIALKAENMARAFYTELAQLAGDPDLQALYVELAAFEEDHVHFLELRIASQTPSRSGID
jgi:rubrerythrin